ncbi:glycyl-radical enzyme activating protein [Draconibacterium sp.]|nr:glycyl-radical enzyme activating protein [Draconibacterium sp.]
MKLSKGRNTEPEIMLYIMDKTNKISIFNIKRFAVHDGPGIRTSVFFKGCSLFCSWCQNPEGISKTKNLLYYKGRCIECYSCIAHCPQNAIEKLPEGEKIHINREICDLCGECVMHCPSGALSFDSKEYSLSGLVQELERDLVFFKESNGGVTFTGGEPLLQAKTIVEIAKHLQKNKIHIAVESSLMVPFLTLKEAVEFVDLFIVDLKILDKQRSKKMIGMDLDLYQKNLEYLFAKDVDLICRVPLIPGYTDSESNLKSIKSFVNELNLKYKRNNSIEPINFNPLSKTKYLQLGQPLPAIERWRKYSGNEIATFYTILNDEK